LAGSRTKTIHSLHEKYGKVVRIGPNEISFTDIGVINDILGLSSPFMKAPIYDSMSVKPPGVFSLRDKEQHRDRRRLLSHAFAQSNLYKTEPLILEHVRELLTKLDSDPEKPKDVWLLFRLLALDIVGAFSSRLND
jgi:cytochrome P450